MFFRYRFDFHIETHYLSLFSHCHHQKVTKPGPPDLLAFFPFVSRDTGRQKSKKPKNEAILSLFLQNDSYASPISLRPCCLSFFLKSYKSFSSVLSSSSSSYPRIFRACAVAVTARRSSSRPFDSCSVRVRHPSSVLPMLFFFSLSVQHSQDKLSNKVNELRIGR